MTAFDPNKPFNDLPPLPPRIEVETRDILKQTIPAERALAELKGLGRILPNQSLLVNSVVLQEAKDSSEIENIVTTNDALFRAFSADTQQVDTATKEVLRYREALWEGYHALRTRQVLSTNLFVTIMQRIKETQAGIRNTPGTTISNSTDGKVVYTPPEGERAIRNKLKNLEEFIHKEDDLTPLVKLALVHYQFEAIHPFDDGNGRAGRIVNILFLVLYELLELPVLYLSKAIIENKNDYYRLLRRVTEDEEWEPWILFMLRAVKETADFTRNRIMTIRELMNETMEEARQELPASVYSKELIDLLFREPYTKVRFLVNEGIAERQTAAKYLKELEKIGILESHKIGRETLYLNRKLYDLLSS